MFNQSRTFILIALFAVAYLLFTQWQSDYHPPQQSAENTHQSSSQNQGDFDATPEAADIPDDASDTAKADADSQNISTSQPASDTHSHIVTVRTDVLELAIDTRGGTIRSAKLLKYPKKLHGKEPIELLSSKQSHFYQAQSGLVGINGADAPSHKAEFKAAKSHYELSDDEDQLKVDLTWQGKDGVHVTKTYTLKPGSYVVDVKQTIDNDGDKVWKGQAYQQLQRTDLPDKDYGNFLEKYSDTSRYSFFGGAWYSPDDKFNKVKLKQFDKSLNGGAGQKVSDGWFAMEQAYFVGAWIPDSKRTTLLSTLELGSEDNPHYLIRGVGPVLSVDKGDQATDDTRLFIGPKVPDILKTVTPSFDLALNYGMMTIVARPLHWVLAHLHKITHNWGWAIILLVLLINLLCYKLYAIQYRSSAHMRRLKPRMDALKERYGDDKQKLQRAMMDMYKKEKVNPMAGCFPILITLPVFFGLYELLRESVELRHAPFIGWIQDLSAADPYFVLPIFYGVVMLIQSLTMPMSPGMDPTQQKMIRFMPVATALFFAFFPAGLALYYSVNGICRLLTMWWVYRQVDKEVERKKAASQSGKDKAIEAKS